MDELQSQFIVDAQEIVERLYRDVEQLRAVRSQGRPRRELAARIFRHVHTLKGSAGSLGLKLISDVAHEFEGVLDGVRLGRVEIDDSVLDAFEDATAAIAGALSVPFAAPSDPKTAALIKRLSAIALASGGQGEIASGLRAALPAEIARALSEYDLQHAREAVREGARLFVVSAGFEIDTFDQKFRELSKLLGHSGEIISTVPGEPASADEINFRLLYAAELFSDKTLRRLSALGRIEVKELPLEVSAVSGKAPIESLPSSASQSVAGLTASVRVELGQLDHLISDASDLFRDAANALVSLATPMSKKAVEASTSLLRRRFVELEERLIKLRLVPLAEMLEGAAARAGRVAARQLGKEVEFEIFGGEVGIDKSLANTIAEPLLHLVRNAVDHGIESPEERRAAGKNATGKVTLAAFSEGSRIHISVSDDGRGINLNRIAAAASQHGIVGEDSDWTMDRALRLIFRPGFSTATEISELSGRGIGLEVVDRAMEQMGGQVRVATEPGTGTTFVIMLPTALALVQCLIVRSNDQFYCIESARVADTRLLDPEESNEMIDVGAINWQGEELPAFSLRKLLAQPDGANSDGPKAAIIWHAANHHPKRNRAKNRFALVVDSIKGQQETLVRSLGRHAAHWPGASGAAELLDGNVALVLDLERLIEVNLDL